MTELTREQKQAILDGVRNKSDVYSGDNFYFKMIILGDLSVSYLNNLWNIEENAKRNWYKLSDLRAELERKTVWDAVNYYHGDLNHYGPECSMIFKAKETGYFQNNNKHEGSELICTSKEFNQCVNDLAGAKWLPGCNAPNRRHNYTAYRKAHYEREEKLAKACKVAEIASKALGSAITKLSPVSNKASSEREGFDNGMRHAMQKISTLIGLKFGVDVGYENLPDKVECALNKHPARAEWVNGDACIFTDKEGEKTTCTVIGLFHPFKESYVLHRMSHVSSGIPALFISNIAHLSKPETPEQKAGREHSEKLKLQVESAIRDVHSAEFELSADVVRQLVNMLQDRGHFPEV